MSGGLSLCPRFKCPGGRANILSPTQGVIICKCGTTTLYDIEFSNLVSLKEMQKIIEKDEENLKNINEKIKNNFILRNSLNTENKNIERLIFANKEHLNLQEQAQKTLNNIHDTKNMYNRAIKEKKNNVGKILQKGSVIKTYN